MQQAIAGEVDQQLNVAANSYRPLLQERSQNLTHVPGRTVAVILVDAVVNGIHGLNEVLVHLVPTTGTTHSATAVETLQARSAPDSHSHSCEVLTHKIMQWFTGDWLFQAITGGTTSDGCQATARLHLKVDCVDVSVIL